MLNSALPLAEELITFIDNSPVSFMAVDNIKDKLESNGFSRLSESEKWDLKPGARHYVTRNDSAVIAFRVGELTPWESGFNIAGAHTDSPLLKIKNESIGESAGCVKVNVEPYGGGIISTWLDRDLSIAGRITVETENGLEDRFIDFKRPIAIIPNLAIHLNREVNKGFEYNKQNHLAALLKTTSNKNDDDIDLRSIIQNEFGINSRSILEMDLFLYPFEKGEVVGLNKDMISAGRLDNLAMCHSILCGLVDSNQSNSTSVGLFFDNEEIGSQTMQGADSNFLSSLLDRIVLGLGGDIEDSFISRSRSFMISADGAHAVHPNFSDKHDSSYSPQLNRGPVIKMSSNFRYSTTSRSSARFISMCRDLEIPYQKIINRSDIPSGSTIGPMSSANLGIEAVDVGNPMFAMHSVRESQGVLDHYYMTKVISHFFSS